MARGEHKENKGQKAAGQADGSQVEPVYEGLPGAVVLGIRMGIVVQGLVGGVQADDHIVVGAVVGIGLGHECRNTGEGGIKVRPYSQVIGIPGIIDIFSHGHHVVDGHFRCIGVDLIDGVIFGIKGHTEIKVGDRKRTASGSHRSAPAGWQRTGRVPSAPPRTDSSASAHNTVPHPLR